MQSDVFSLFNTGREVWTTSLTPSRAMNPKARIRSCCLPVVFLLAGILLSGTAMGQQMSPLAGQNPGGPPTDEEPALVYVNIILDKLLLVDASSYRFEVSMTVALSWRDSRIIEIWSTAEAATFLRTTSVLSSFQRCLAVTGVNILNGNYSSIYSASAENAAESAECITAVEGPARSQCLRLCNAEQVAYCCDLVWLPSITFPNVVALSQDRLVSDDIYPLLNTTYGGAQYGTPGVTRVVKVQATFTAAMLFQRFPFDKQRLVVKMEAVDRGFQLTASGVMKDASGTGLFTQEFSRSDELPGWKVERVDLTCKEGVLTDYTTWFNQRPQDARDPLMALFKSQAETGASRGASACELAIYVKRQWNFYFWSTLFPVVCSVHLAFLNFVVIPTNLDLRVATTITLFLALTALQFTTTSELPSSSYLTAYHKLMLTSYLVLVMIAAESVLAYHICTRKLTLEQLGRLQTLGNRNTESTELQDDGSLTQEESQREPEQEEAMLDEGSELDSTKRDWMQHSSRSMAHNEEAHSIESLESQRSRIKPPVLGQVNSFLSLRRLGKVIEDSHVKISLDAAYGFRAALWLDKVAGLIFSCGFWVAILAIFLG